MGFLKWLCKKEIESVKRQINSAEKKVKEGKKLLKKLKCDYNKRYS